MLAMAAHDRDYMQDSSGVTPGPRLSTMSLTARLIAINAVVWVLWQVPPLKSLMAAHFVVSPLGVLEDFRVWTLFTSAFSHEAPLHLVFNMILLWVFCPELERVYGRRNVAFLYLLAGLGCSLAHVGLSLATGRPAASMLGASGAVMGVVAVAVLLNPQRQLFLFGVIPMPAWALGGLFVVADLAGLAGGQADNVSHVGHLGGLAVGAAFKLLDLRLFRGEGQLPGRGRLSAWLDPPPKLRVLPPLPPEEREPSLDAREAEQERIDADTATRVDDLLRKISETGLDSLTPEEKAFLEEASLKYKR